MNDESPYWEADPVAKHWLRPHWTIRVLQFVGLAFVCVIGLLLLPFDKLINNWLVRRGGRLRGPRLPDHKRN